MDNQILAAFLREGVTRVGVCRMEDIALLPGHRAASRLPGGLKSLIVCLLPYYCGEFPRRNVARYAVCEDYHITAGALLRRVCHTLTDSFPGHVFLPFIDSSPIPEVYAARLAGLGVVGRHGMLLAPDLGSCVFIGSVITDIALEPDAPLAGECLNCGACVAACPTGALGGEGFSRERCRSHITQIKGELDPWQSEQVKLGGLAWGCDLCLDACPLNKKHNSPIEELCLNPEPVITEDNLEALLPGRAYGYRGKATVLRNLRLISSG